MKKRGVFSAPVFLRFITSYCILYATDETSAESSFLQKDMPDVINPQEKIIKNKRPKGKRSKKNSKFFKNLLCCLKKKKHVHMLWYISANKFKVKLVDKKSPLWRESDIILCEELDFKRERDKHQKNYAEKCKQRFKSNMGKLCANNYLREVKSLDSEKPETCISIKTYEILPKTEMENDTDDKKSLKGTSIKKERERKSCSTSVVSNETSIEFNDESHYSCLSQKYDSKENKINVATNMNGILNNSAENQSVSNSLIGKNPESLSTNIYTNDLYILVENTPYIIQYPGVLSTVLDVNNVSNTLAANSNAFGSFATKIQASSSTVLDVNNVSNTLAANSNAFGSFASEIQASSSNLTERNDRSPMNTGIIDEENCQNNLTEENDVSAMNTGIIDEENCQNNLTERNDTSSMNTDIIDEENYRNNLAEINYMNPNTDIIDEENSQNLMMYDECPLKSSQDPFLSSTSLEEFLHKMEYMDFPEGNQKYLQDESSADWLTYFSKIA